MVLAAGVAPDAEAPPGADQVTGAGALSGADPVTGFYGPSSAMWHVNREAVLLGAGPAALLLQIAHPLVAEGVAAHSRFQADPFGRLRRTLRTTLELIFGDAATAERAVLRLNTVHAGVHGDVHDPEARTVTGRDEYHALEPDLLLWVQATLIVTSVRAYRRWVGGLDPEVAEDLWREARLVGQRLGIPLAMSPATFPALESWFEHTLRPGGPIEVTPTARGLAREIIRPPIPILPGFIVDLLALPGLALLPERIRSGFGISWSQHDAIMAATMSTAIHGWTTIIPAAWRAMPQARAADERVRHATQRRLVASAG